MKKNGTFHAAVAAVILNENNEVLLTQRSLTRDHHPGAWEITAGRLDQGESFEQALAREAKEELGIRLKIHAPLNTFHFYRGSEKVEHIGVTFICNVSEGVPKVDGVEEVAWRWVPLKEAMSLVADASVRQALVDAEVFTASLKHLAAH